MITRKIEEHIIEGKRLGRHIEHDPRSKDFAFGATVQPHQLKKVHHRRYGYIFDQGNLGSCTGNAVAGAINTAPLHHAHSVPLKENEAVNLYELATTIDEFDGEYPPDDTGSSGLAAAKAAQQKGYISAYKHAFSVDEALAALQIGPVIVGVNWYEGFDNPAPTGELIPGLVKINGQIRGGHEFELLGFIPQGDPNEALVIADNSWGHGWGINGGFCFTVDTLKRLLDNQGDATILVR